MTPPARGRGTSQRSPTVLVSYKLFLPALPSPGNEKKKAKCNSSSLLHCMQDQHQQNTPSNATYY